MKFMDWNATWKVDLDSDWWSCAPVVGRDSAAGVLSLHLSSRCGRYSSDWPSLWPEMDYLDQASGHKQVWAKCFPAITVLEMKRLMAQEYSSLFVSRRSDLPNLGIPSIDILLWNISSQGPIKGKHWGSKISSDYFLLSATNEAAQVFTQPFSTTRCSWRTSFLSRTQYIQSHIECIVVLPPSVMPFLDTLASLDITLVRMPGLTSLGSQTSHS